MLFDELSAMPQHGVPDAVMRYHRTTPVDGVWWCAQVCLGVYLGVLVCAVVHWCVLVYAGVRGFIKVSWIMVACEGDRQN